MTIARLAIDTGYETSAVYDWARQMGFAQVAPLKGMEGSSRASPVTGPTYVDATLACKRLRRGARPWTGRCLNLRRPLLPSPAAGEADAGRARS